MDLDPGEEIFFRGHPSWRSMAPFYVKRSLASLIVGVIAGLASAVADGRVQVGWVIAGVLIVFGLALSTGRLRRQRTTYAITSHRLTIETGLFSRTLHEARLDFIETIGVRQSMAQRLLRVGSVDFDTAADFELGFSFEGVDDPRGLAGIVDHVLGGHQLPVRPVHEWARI